MKYWTNVYRIAEQALCLDGIDSIHWLLSQEGVKQIKIKVKKEMQYGKVRCGYATLEISIDDRFFDYKFIVSWDDKKFEDVNFWITTVKESYIICKNNNFLNNLYEFNREINQTWEHLSKWIVQNTDYNELIVDKNSNLKDIILGTNFNKDFEYTQLNILLDQEKFKEKVKKI